MITQSMIEAHLAQALADRPETKFQLRKFVFDGGRARTNVLFATQEKNGDLTVSEQHHIYEVVDGRLSLQRSESGGTSAPL